MTQHLKKTHLFLIPILFFALEASAELFSNSYVSFQLPPRWKCEQEATEWICRSTNKDEAKQAIIVLTAKEVGANDSIPAYLAYLKQSKSTPGAGQKPTMSVVKDVRIRKLQNHDWVDGLHLGSEIANYYTRYLATVKTNIAVLITFSAHQKFYTRYSNDFFAAINSLVVKGVAMPDANVGKSFPGQGGIIGAPIGGIGGSDIIESDDDYVDSDSEPTDTKEYLFLFGIILLAIGAYFFIKQKQKKDQQKPF